MIHLKKWSTMDGLSIERRVKMIRTYIALIIFDILIMAFIIYSVAQPFLNIDIYKILGLF